MSSLWALHLSRWTMRRRASRAGEGGNANVFVWMVEASGETSVVRCPSQGHVRLKISSCEGLWKEEMG